MIEELNKYIAEYVDNYSLEEYPELINHIKKITKLIMDNPPSFEEKEYLLDIKLQTSQELASEFLNYIGIGFNDILKPNVKSFKMHFTNYAELSEDDNPISYSDFKDGNLDVNITYYNDLSDCYTIIHELLHASNVVEEDDLVKICRRDILTETVSLLGTIEAEKYFLKTRFNDEFKINKMDDYYGIYENTKKTNDSLKLVDIYLKNKQITSNDLSDINEDTIDEIIALKEVQIPFYERYLLAYVLANYIEHNFNGKDVLKQLTQMICNNSLEEIFAYLDLDFNVIKVNNIEYVNDISDESINKLEQSLKGKSK